MSIKNIVQFLALGAIWGASFIFVRVLVPALGPIATANVRTLLAGVVLSIYLLITKFDPEWKKFWKQYVIIGILNTGIPFILFAYAALHLPASYLAILNSTTPLFTAVFSVMWLSDKIDFSRMCGLILGVIGVTLISRVGSVDLTVSQGLSIIASLGAAASYALTGIYIQLFTKGARPKAIAASSQLFAGVLLFPLIFLMPPTGEITFSITSNMLALSLLCSAIAYLMYFDLMKDVGPTKALTVTYLIPLFGMLWGAIFLGEIITMKMIVGCGFIFLGTFLVLNIIKFRSRSKIY